MEKQEARIAAGATGKQTIVRIGHPVPAEWIGLEWFVMTTLPPGGAMSARGDLMPGDLRQAGGSCWRETDALGREREHHSGRDYAARALLEESGLPVFMLEERTHGRIRGKGGGRGRRGMYDRNFLPGYLFLGGRAAMVAVCAQMARWRRQERHHPLTRFLDHDGTPQRASGADMATLFMAHDQLAHVPRDERDSLQRRFAIGQMVQLSEGPFSFVPAIVEAYLTGKRVRILEQLSGREIAIETELDKLEAIGV